jgi:serine/threonine protein kinase
MEFVPSDEIYGLEETLRFSRSLVDVIKKLHDMAGILHGDIKPSNVRWNRTAGTVVLIDFGHSQWIQAAKSRRSTKGFEAPEILDGRPVTTSTDAFAVGRTISYVLSRCVHGKAETGTGTTRRILMQVAERLQDEDPKSRWTLSMAWNRLFVSSKGAKDSTNRTIASTDVASEKETKRSDMNCGEDSPPHKMAKVVTPGPRLC